MPKESSDLANYLKDIKNINEKDNEHTYRRELHNLFETLRDKIFEKYNDKSENKIFINHEQSQANSGNEESKRPDFRVSKISSDASGLTIGNIENKKVNENLQKTHRQRKHRQKRPSLKLFQNQQKSHPNRLPKFLAS